MDLSTLKTIAEWREDSLRNARNVTMPKKLSNEVVEALRVALLKSPGRRTSERADVQADKQPRVFFPVLMSILSLGSVWYDHSIRENGIAERPFDVAVRLTKKLFDFSYNGNELNKTRIARGLFLEERLLKVRTFGPQDWLLTIRRLRQQAQSAEIEKTVLSKQTAWDCLLAMCCESIVDRPIEPFDSGLPLCLEPDRVQQEDLALGPSIFDTFAQQMDAFGKTFGSFQWTVGALTKVWILALADKLETGWKIPVLKKQFGQSPPKNKKDFSTIFRNMIFNFGILWTVSRDIINQFTQKNFKMLESTVSDTVFSHALQGTFPKTIEAMMEAKMLTRPIGLFMQKQSLLLQGLMLRLHQHIHTLKSMHLREKFVLSDQILRRQTVFQPEHSKVFLESNLNQTLPVVTSWTMLTDAQLGQDGILGSDSNDSTEIAIKILTSLTSDIASDLEILWHMMTHPEMWLSKKVNGSLLLNRLPDSQNAKNETSQLPAWIPSPSDWAEMRKIQDASYVQTQKMQIDAIAEAIEL